MNVAQWKKGSHWELSPAPTKEQLEDECSDFFYYDSAGLGLFIGGIFMGGIKISKEDYLHMRHMFVLADVKAGEVPCPLCRELLEAEYDTGDSSVGMASEYVVMCDCGFGVDLLDDISKLEENDHWMMLVRENYPDPE